MEEWDTYHIQGYSKGLTSWYDIEDATFNSTKEAKEHLPYYSYYPLCRIVKRTTTQTVVEE